MNINTQVLPKLEVRPVPNGYIWGEDSEFLFQQTLCTLTQPIKKFLNSKFDNQSNKLNVDGALELDIIMIAADKSLKRVRKKNKPKSTSKNKKIVWNKSTSIKSQFE